MSSHSQSVRSLALLAVLLPVLAAPAADVPPRRLLASQFISAAMTRTMAQPLTVDALDATVILIEEALQLDPDNLELWRLTLDIAQLGEREDLKNRAVERLVQLDPADEIVRLMRLNAAIDRFQVIEERIAAYEELLRDENVPRLGPAVASRLALDLALLHQRQGDVEQFSRWLSRSVALDSANRVAAAMAAGFFRLNVADPLAEAELLTNVVLADPTDVNTQIVLGQLLLENGAYKGADRLYRLAMGCLNADLRPAANDLLADQAVAQWAKGDHEAALETIRKRQAEVDTYIRNLARQDKPEITLTELSQLSGPVDPHLATVAAVIHTGRGDDQAAASVAAAIAAYQAQLDAVLSPPAKSGAGADQPAPATQPATRPANPAALARVYLEMAWVTVWLGGDIEKVPAYLAAAADRQPLDPQASSRFDGWLALRRGDLAKAAEKLEPIAPTDNAATIGLALVLQQQGRKVEAAREFLAAARAQPGSLIGIWAAGKLTALLGQVAPLSDQVAAMERLIASIPDAVDRYPDEPSMAISLRLIPTKTTYTAYEPILIDIEIANNSVLPLGLDRDGPLRPQVLIVPTVQSTDVRGLGDLPAFVVNVGRRFRLMPREHLTVRFDLRNYHPVGTLNAAAIGGSIVKLKSYLNFFATPAGTAKPGLYGCEAEALLVRVDGQRMTDQWVQDTVSQMQDVGAPGLLQRMALLGRKIAPRLPMSATEQEYKLNEAARLAFAEAFAKLDEISQAWILTVLPRESGPRMEGLQQTLAIAKKSEHRLVQMAYLIYQAGDLTDPMLDAAKRSQDSALRRLAEVIHADAQRAAEENARRR